MSPIDDELRAALHGRATAVAPSPDPLAGIERRARRIQRNRIAASVASSALAVAAIAAVVPALQDAGRSPRQDLPPVASAAPSQAPPTLAPAPSYVLDPERPWAFRGTPVDEGTRATIQREYADVTRGAEVLVTPLFAQVYEPSAQQEVVFLAEVDGAYRWGVAAATESGPEFVWDAALPASPEALAAALPGDEVARLLVVAAPGTTSIAYGPDPAAEPVPMAALAPGVATGALEGDRATDSYRLVRPEGEVIEDAPDPVSAPPEPEAPTDLPDPTTVPAGYGWDTAEPWDYRGKAELDAANLAVEDERLFTATHGEGWTTRPLYGTDHSSGVSVLVVLHTKPGQPALVSTTWQRGDRAAEQTDQVVDQGQAMVQASVPTDTDDGTRLLVALGSPKAGGIVLTGERGNRPAGDDDPGAGLWVVQESETAQVRLYTEGDGVEYAVEPARTS